MTAGNYYQLTVQSLNMNDVRNYSVQLTNAVRYQGLAWNSQIAFTIVVQNPCARTTFTAITVATITYNLHANELLSTTLKDPKDATSTALSNGWASCGVRTYKFLEGGVAPAYASILTLPATNDFKIEVKTDSEAFIGTHTI